MRFVGVRAHRQKSVNSYDLWYAKSGFWLTGVALREQLEAATGERFSALEGIGEMSRGVAGKTAETELYDDREFGDRSERNTVKDRKGPELERGRGAEMDLGL